MVALIAISVAVLALLLWIYFDANERGKSGILWVALAVFFYWVLFIPLILYFILRDRDRKVPIAPGMGLRQYLYIASFVGFGLLFIGLSLVVSVPLFSVSDSLDRNDFRENLAAAFALVIIGFPIWAFHWYRCEARLQRIVEESELRATFSLHRIYLNAVLGVSGLVLLSFGLWFLVVLLRVILDVEGADASDFVIPLGPVIVAVFSIFFHFAYSMETPVFKQLSAQFAGVAPGLAAATPAPAPSPAASPPSEAPPAPAAPAGTVRPLFCGKCGAENDAANVFCTGCGQRLAPA